MSRRVARCSANVAGGAESTRSINRGVVTQVTHDPLRTSGGLCAVALNVGTAVYSACSGWGSACNSPARLHRRRLRRRIMRRRRRGFQLARSVGRQPRDDPDHAVHLPGEPAQPDAAAADGRRRRDALALARHVGPDRHHRYQHRPLDRTWTVTPGTAFYISAWQEPYQTGDPRIGGWGYCPPVQAPTNLTCTRGSLNQLTVSWTADPNADRYRIRLDGDDTNILPYVGWPDLTATSWTWGRRRPPPWRSPAASPLVPCGLLGARCSISQPPAPAERPT